LKETMAYFTEKHRQILKMMDQGHKITLKENGVVRKYEIKGVLSCRESMVFYLLKNDWIKPVAERVYAITDKGRSVFSR